MKFDLTYIKKMNYNIKMLTNHTFLDQIKINAYST